MNDITKRSKLDPSQIVQAAYDTNLGAIKTSMVGTEVEIDLSHMSGDSMTAHPVRDAISAEGIVAPGANGTVIIASQDCSSLSSIHVYVNGTGTATVEVSPSDFDNVWYTLGSSGSILPVCARRVRVKSVNVNGAAYLVGKS